MASTRFDLWPPARDAELTRLWCAALPDGRPEFSSVAIAALLRCTKNSVVGRAHRLRLPPRPSPIRGHVPVTPKPKVLRAGADILPILPSARPFPPIQAGVFARAVARSPRFTVQSLVDAVIAAERAPVATAFRDLPRNPCCWPIGEPRTPSFRYCDAPGDPGQSYCAAHRKVAYIGKPPRRQIDNYGRIS